MDDIGLAVCRTLLLMGPARGFGAGASDEEAAGELLELLGAEAFEAVGQLMEQRRALGEALGVAIGKVRDELAAEEAADAPAAMPSYGTGVTITSGSQKLLAKLERKDRRRGGGAGGGGAAGGGGVAGVGVWLGCGGVGPWGRGGVQHRGYHYQWRRGGVPVGTGQVRGKLSHVHSGLAGSTFKAFRS